MRPWCLVALQSHSDAICLRLPMPPPPILVVIGEVGWWDCIRASQLVLNECLDLCAVCSLCSCVCWGALYIFIYTNMPLLNKSSLMRPQFNFSKVHVFNNPFFLPHLCKTTTVGYGWERSSLILIKKENINCADETQKCQKCPSTSPSYWLFNRSGT